MRRALILVHFVVGFALAVPAGGQQMVDRIVARVQGDIITLSEVRELERYQQLVEGHAEDDVRAVAELVQQWVVNTEAQTARFPMPAAGQIDREIAQLEAQFASAEAFRARLRELELTEDAVRRLVGRQIYLSRYLDYKFRPAVQVEATEVEKYYRNELVPELKAEGKSVPPLETLRDQIRELLTQRGISERTAKWLDQATSRLKIEVEPAGSGF